jgi:hypothetical protein
VTVTADIVMTAMNSPSMNMANFAPEYSVWKPPTSSPSASARSNGGRCASATAEMKKIRNAGAIGIRFQAGRKPHSVPDCAATISEARSVPL